MVLFSKKQLVNVFLEVLGTAVFAFLGGSAPSEDSALANGLVLAAAITCTEGAHLNPSVSLSSLITGGIKLHVTIAYWIAQISGAFIGVGLQLLLLPDLTGDPGCFAGASSDWQIFAFEAIGSFCLVLTIQSVALRFDQFANPGVLLSNDSNGRLGPLTIGLALTAIALSIGQYTGGAYNPARVIAPALLMRCASARRVFVYLFGQLLGCIFASAVALLVWYRGLPCLPESDARDSPFTLMKD